jgi:ankyrin repeat protein
MNKIFARRLAWGAFYTGLFALFLGQIPGILLAVIGLAAALLLRDGQTSGFLHAVETGDVARAREILASPEGDKTLARHGPKALFLAASRGHGELVDLLLTKGVNPNVLAPGDDSALGWAIAAGHPAIARRLLEAGADPCLKKTGAGGLGDTPLGSAIRQDDTELFEAMLKSGRVSQEHLTKGLNSAVVANRPLSHLRLLLNAGAQPEKAIVSATLLKQSEMLQLLHSTEMAGSDEPPLLEPPKIT